MSLLATLATLVHVLMFVYWLGADLGTFYSSYLMIDAKRSREGRLAALKIWSSIDMAPRTAMILVLPTGLTLATVKGWLATPPWLLAAVWLIAAVWMFVAWRIQIKRSGPTAWDRRLDTAIRWFAVAALALTGVLGLAGVIPMPLFIGVKLLLLSAGVLIGLLIRIVLEPFGPAIGALIAGKATPATDKRMRDLVIQRAKPLVILIWAVTLAAAFMGVWHPA